MANNDRLQRVTIIRTPIANPGDVQNNLSGVRGNVYIDNATRGATKVEVMSGELVSGEMICVPEALLDFDGESVTL